MAIKLFPNLERIAIKEHAKSDNYEDYIGVVLDKRNNVFKVVEGQFRDKKEMYEKMKARGLILRKAYERKVWEWIEKNADGVIISYLMLSTAFSKWRSNNVLHKYYEKLLKDLPELNREREKGNPNTRGGDFITKDDRPAPKRKEDESVELEEERKQYDNEAVHDVELVGVIDETEEPLEYQDTIEIPDGAKFPVNIDFLNHIKSLLTNTENGFNKIHVQLLDKDGNVRMNPSYNLFDVEKRINKYNTNDIQKSLKNKVNYKVKLFGVKQDEEGIEFIQNMPVLFATNGELKDPAIASEIDEYLNTDNIRNMTGTSLKDRYKKIKVYVDGKCVKEYDKNSAANDLKEIYNNRVSYGITNAANVNNINSKRIEEIERELKDINERNKSFINDTSKLNTIKDKLKQTDEKSEEYEELKKQFDELEDKYNNGLVDFVSSDEKKKELIDELKSLYLSNNIASKDQFVNSVNALHKQDWQGKVANFLHTDSKESRESLSNSPEREDLDKFLNNLITNEGELERYNSYIEDLLYDEDFRGSNTSFSLTNQPFKPMSKGQLEDIRDKIKYAEPLSNNEKERKSLLHNLIWYILANNRQNNEAKKNQRARKTGIADLDRVSDLNQFKQALPFSSGGSNPKTQTGDLNADIKKTDTINKVNKELARLGLVTPKSKKVNPTPDQEKKAGELAKQISNKREQDRINNAKSMEPAPDTTPEPLKQINKKIADEYDLAFRKTSSSDDRINFYDVKRLTYQNIGNKLKLDPEKRTEYFLNHLDEYEAELKRAINQIEKERPKKDEVKVVMSPEERLEKAIKDYKNYKDLQNISFEDYVKANKDRNKPVDYDEYSKKLGNFTFQDLYKAKKVSSFEDLLDRDTKGIDAIKEIKNLRNEFLKKYQNEDAFFDILKKNGLSFSDLEESQVNDGATLIHRYSPYQGAGFNYSAGPIKMTGQIVEDTTRTELNPKLFENDMLIPEVRDALYKIATAFKDYLDLPFEIKDIYFTGSNANYNYTDDSDIDLHLVYDFEQAGANAELLSKYLVAAKKDFNDKYDIKVKGIPVELGCENIAEPLVSTGVYSLGANTWVIKPNNSGIEIPDVDMNAFNDLSMQIDDTIKAQNASAIENLWKMIKKLRKDSLADEGEFGMGNMLFKKLRNADYLEKLRNSMYNAQSKELSLESSENLDEAELNDKKDYSEYLSDLKNELESSETQDLLADKSLLKYLDGYRDKNQKREIESHDGVLNEGDIPNWRLNKAIKYIDKGIPPEISSNIFVDSDGISLCRFKYDMKNNELFKIPVKRQKIMDGKFSFVSVPEEMKPVSKKEFYKILTSEKNQSILSKTSLYDVYYNPEETKQEINQYKTAKQSRFNKWYEENKDLLDLDNLLINNKKLRNSIIYKMYKDNTESNVRLDNLRKKYADYYNIKEASESRLSVNKDMNDINAIFTAIGIDPEYVTRPIYEHIKKRNPKTMDWEDVERQWKIVGVDDVRDYLHDDQFDFTAMPYNKIGIYMKDVNSMDSRPQKFTAVELNNIINSSDENDINNDSAKLAYDIHKQLPNNSNRFRQQTRQTYNEIQLTPDQVRAALAYVQSKENTNRLLSDIEQLKATMSKLNPEKEGDEELLDGLQRELDYKRSILDLKYSGNGNLIEIYDGLTSMKQNGFKAILRALNSVEDGVTVIPRYLITDPHGFGFYIKMPEEGFSYEDIKSHGSYEPKDTIKDVKKFNRSF